MMSIERFPLDLVVVYTKSGILRCPNLVETHSTNGIIASMPSFIGYPFDIRIISRSLSKLVVIWPLSLYFLFFVFIWRWDDNRVESLLCNFPNRLIRFTTPGSPLSILCLARAPQTPEKTTDRIAFRGQRETNWKSFGNPCVVPS